MRSSASLASSPLVDRDHAPAQAGIVLRHRREDMRAERLVGIADGDGHLDAGVEHLAAAVRRRLVRVPPHVELLRRAADVDRDRLQRELGVGRSLRGIGLLGRRPPLRHPWRRRRRRASAARRPWRRRAASPRRRPWWRPSASAPRPSPWPDRSWRPRAACRRRRARRRRGPSAVPACAATPEAMPPRAPRPRRLSWPRRPPGGLLGFAGELVGTRRHGRDGLRASARTARDERNRPGPRRSAR